MSYKAGGDVAYVCGYLNVCTSACVCVLLYVVHVFVLDGASTHWDCGRMWFVLCQCALCNAGDAGCVRF